jgi:hypothetical protein
MNIKGNISEQILLFSVTEFIKCLMNKYRSTPNPGRELLYNLLVQNKKIIRFTLLLWIVVNPNYFEFLTFTPILYRGFFLSFPFLFPPRMLLVL